MGKGGNRRRKAIGGEKLSEKRGIKGQRKEWGGGQTKAGIKQGRENGGGGVIDESKRKLEKRKTLGKG